MKNGIRKRNYPVLKDFKIELKLYWLIPVILLPSKPCSTWTPACPSYIPNSIHGKHRLPDPLKYARAHRTSANTKFTDRLVKCYFVADRVFASRVVSHFNNVMLIIIIFYPLLLLYYYRVWTEKYIYIIIIIMSTDSSGSETDQCCIDIYWDEERKSESQLIGT